MTMLSDSQVLTQKVEEIKSNISVDELEEMTRPYDLADAILEGSAVSGQAYEWCDGSDGSLCALSAAATAARARGLI